MVAINLIVVMLVWNKLVVNGLNKNVKYNRINIVWVSIKLEKVQNGLIIK